MMVKRNNNLKSVIVFIIFCIVVSVFIFQNEGDLYDFEVLLSSFFISIISLYKVFKSKRFKYPYSLHQIFHLFILFFFGLAPAIQFKQKSLFWGNDILLTKSDYLLGNIIVLAILLLFNISYNLMYLNLFSKKKMMSIN